MVLKENFINMLQSLGIDVTKLSIEDYEECSIVSFSDKVEEELINVSVTFFKDNTDYEIIIRRKVDIANRTQALEIINSYNKNYSGVAFYIENNEIFAIRSLERYENEIQEILTNISVITEIILLNEI